MELSHSVNVSRGKTRKDTERWKGQARGYMDSVSSGCQDRDCCYLYFNEAALGDERKQEEFE